MDTVNNGLDELRRLFNKLPASSLVGLIVFVGPGLVCQDLTRNNEIWVHS
jgi:hypothetical protein